MKTWDILKIDDKLEGLRKRWRVEVDNRPIIEAQAECLNKAKDLIIEKIFKK